MVIKMTRNNDEGISPKFEQQVEELIEKIRPDESNKQYQFVKRLCEDDKFREKWEEYLELRRKMNAATNRLEADVYFKKAKKLLVEIK
jgi:quinol monooxygenase YgiN